MVAKELCEQASLVAHESVIDGRVLRSKLQFQDGAIILWNIHNERLTAAQRLMLLARIEADR
eukprot:7923692-Karenia_brevis.AAC.1